MINRIAFITGDAMNPAYANFLATCGRPSLEKPITPPDVRNLVDKIIHDLRESLSIQ
ncbi:MAG: hypothetical protein HON65_09645 [Rhodospirillales bacterium]|nr:hypothetical protein [Rhodospirillales bacterium]